MTISAETIRTLRSWREPGRGILRFVDDNFGVTLDPWQERALEAFGGPEERLRLSLQACAGPGKSAVGTWCGWWFLATQGDKGEHPKGAATSVTSDNLKDNLWAEFAKWQARSAYLQRAFEWTSTRIAAVDHPSTWFLSARSWPKTASSDEQGKTFSGLHSQFPLVIVDESGAIPATILRAAEQALSSCRFGRLLQAGNPISLEGMLYEAATTLRHLWTIIRITGDPDDPNAWVHAPRVGTGPREWAAEQIRTYGRDNPWVKSYILGEFPPASINALLGVEDVQRAFDRVLPPDAYDWQEKRLGVDVARFGDDRSVIFPRQGLAAFRPITLRNERTTAIAARVARALGKWAPEGGARVFIDDTGHWGHGVVDNLITARLPATPVVFSDKAHDKRYKNRRAEMWIRMADAVKAGMMLPDVGGLMQELTAVTYTFLNGQFVLEEKDQVKKRIGRSPDLADALALTFAEVDMPRGMAEEAASFGSAHARTDWDPLEQGRAVHEWDPIG